METLINSLEADLRYCSIQPIMLYL